MNSANHQSMLPPLFPFAAIAGQPELQRALLLAALDPQIGGVLVEGPRGTAKSTAARALAELMPQAPFVTLPLGASLEHLVGTLDLQQALAGNAVQFAPGLLSRAHEGVLYVDEINLLPDALVDVLLDVAASGMNVIERDGISHSHAARFVLVGTMNPEEGSLRPQLLDRLGLCVRLQNVSDVGERRAIVRARLAFDADPLVFRAQFESQQQALARQLATARERLLDRAALALSDEVLHTASEICIHAQVDGMRADLVLLRAARAFAAWSDAAEVLPMHVESVAELVLAHRAKSPQARSNQAVASAPQMQDDRARSPSTEDRRQTQSTRSQTGQHDTPANQSQSNASDDWGVMPPEAVPVLRRDSQEPSPYLQRRSESITPKKV